MNKIKDLAVGVLGFVAVISVVGRVGYWENHYDRQATVTDVVVCETEYLVEVEDAGGYTWEFYAENREDFKMGDNVKMRMCTMDTDSNIFDDVIEDVKLVK